MGNCDYSRKSGTGQNKQNRWDKEANIYKANPPLLVYFDSVGFCEGHLDQARRSAEHISAAERDFGATIAVHVATQPIVILLATKDPLSDDLHQRLFECVSFDRTKNDL